MLYSQVLKVISDKSYSFEASILVWENRVQFQTVEILYCHWLPSLISISPALTKSLLIKMKVLSPILKAESVSVSPNPNWKLVP